MLFMNFPEISTLSQYDLEYTYGLDMRYVIKNETSEGSSLTSIAPFNNI